MDTTSINDLPGDNIEMNIQETKQDMNKIRFLLNVIKNRLNTSFTFGSES